MRARIFRSTSNVGLASVFAVWLAIICAVAVSARAHVVRDASAEAVAIPGSLPEIVIGQPTAKVTIVEYVSLTCPRCAEFQADVPPLVKQKYIDTGLVRLIVREFPLDRLAAAAAMLVRCAGGPEQSYAMISEFLLRQSEWLVREGNALPKLLAFIARFGFDEPKLAACQTNDALLQKLVAVRDRAAKEFNVRSTPTFFVNGKGLEGGRSLEADPMLR